MSKVIVHIDLNAFFARAEEIKDPSLEGKAHAIGRNGRSGIISTCSYEARKYGVRSAMPVFQALKLCPHLILNDGDYRFYETLSNEFINFIESYTKIIEVASIDECFADFTDVIKHEKDIEAFFKELQQNLLKKTKLKCSIGIAPTKFLAKMASDYRKPMGITIIRRKDIPSILYPIPIEDMFGIGKKTAPKLKEIGINTIGDLAKECNNDNIRVQNLLGKFFYAVKDWVNGYGDDVVNTEPWDPKSIGNSRTLMHDMDNYQEIRPTLLYLANEVSSRAKKENKRGSTVQIVIKEAGKDANFKSHNKSITFDTPTNEVDTIMYYVDKLYQENFLGIKVRLVGVTLQNLVDPKDMVIQMTLFDYEKHEEENATRLLINELNRQLKKPLLMRASEVKKDGNK